MVMRNETKIVVRYSTTLHYATLHYATLTHLLTNSNAATWPERTAARPGISISIRTFTESFVISFENILHDQQLPFSFLLLFSSLIFVF